MQATKYTVARSETSNVPFPTGKKCGTHAAVTVVVVAINFLINCCLCTCACVRLCYGFCPDFRAVLVHFSPFLSQYILIWGRLQTVRWAQSCTPVFLLPAHNPRPHQVTLMRLINLGKPERGMILIGCVNVIPAPSHCLLPILIPTPTRISRDTRVGLC